MKMQNDIADPRMRTFVHPRRIVWQTPVKRFDDGWPTRSEVIGAERLLDRKFGQVCEGPFGTSNGTKLVNRGEPAGILLDFGRELHGGIGIGTSPCTTAGARLRLRFGESVSEAMSSIGDGRHASNDHAMRDFELDVPRFGSIEVGNTGFRFVRIDLVAGGEVGLEFVRAVSLMRPMEAVGSFRSSDDRLDRIFETAVRTVHLCCQDFLWDGIKRDRLVWLGDMHPETMGVLAVFGAASILPETLDYAVAVTPPDVWMNTMPTYTLWWIRILAEWCRFTGDSAYLGRHADYLEKTFDHVLAGMEGGRWLANNFLDWPTKHNDAAATAGTQGLALMAARETVFLAEAAGRSALADKARAMAAELEKLRPDPHGAKSAAAMLALSGLRDPKEMFAEVLGTNGHAGVSTFYGYYMIEAMSAAGEDQRALDTVRDYWGAMLDVGATSFWEDFKLDWTQNCFRIDELPVPGKKDVHGDFGEFCYPGFRHSLCHGWACGPAPWCIHHVLGIRPLDAGCRTVEVKPSLCDLAWAEGALALPDGQAVKVRAERKPDGSTALAIDAPSDVTIVR
jgi:alpha-L-rhamnosidase